MSASGYIRRHIFKFVADKPFSIRDCLIYGSRNLVDQVFHKMLKQGRIVRVARGVYIKSGAPKPSTLEIVQVKAAAFGRTIVTHGSQAAARLDKRCRGNDKLIFACNGPTSSFRIGDRKVHLVHASIRKMRLGDTATGLAIRALWQLGKKTCDAETAARIVFDFRRSDRKELRLSGSIMPQWMRLCFSRIGRMNCQRWDVEPLPTRCH